MPEAFCTRRASTSAIAAMPFLSKDEFQEWADDGSNVWQPVNASGAFRGLCCATDDKSRNLKILKGTSRMKYRIITDAWNPRIEVAQADTEEEFLDLLTRLNSLTVQDVMVAACSNRKDMLEQLVQRALKIDVAATIEGERCVSREQYQKIPSLEGEKASLQFELEEARQALRSKEFEKKKLQDELQQALGKLADQGSHAAEATDVTTSESQRDDLSLLGEGQDEVQPLQPWELDGMSLEQRVLRGPFNSSLAKEFWQLAAAPYREVSCNRVEMDGKVWEVIAENPAQDILVIGRRDRNSSILEVGFRGTVTEDAYGDRSANWSTLDATAVALQDEDGTLEDHVLVHKGFLDAYFTISSAAISWLERAGRPGRCLRIAGHSLGAVLATFFAVDVTGRGWQIEGVVTFGSPRLGRNGFRQFYRKLNLHHCTMRFTNQSDFVPCVPPSSWGFEHVVEEYALGPTCSGTSADSSHALTRGSKSYHHALQDAVAAWDSNRMACSKSASSSTAADVSDVQELAVDSSLLPPDVAKLAEDMVAAVQEICERFWHVYDWKWRGFLEIEMFIESVNQMRRPSWHQSVLKWFHDCKGQLKRLFAAAELELQTQNSELALKFVILYLRVTSFLTAAMSHGVPPSDAQKEYEDILAGAKELVSNCFHLETSQLNEIVQLLSADDVFPQDVHVTLQGQILRFHGRSFQLGSPLFQLMKWCGEPEMDVLEVRLGKDDAMNADRMLWQLLNDMPPNLTSLSLDCKSCWRQITDAFVQQLASSMPPNLTSLKLQIPARITDSSLQQLACSMPQSLTSLCLDFKWCHQITDAFVQQLATSMPPNLTSLSLDFKPCNVANTALQQLASSIPQSLTALSLDFNGCDQITDAFVHQLAMSMPPNLISLSLDFLFCHRLTDASFQQLASSLPQNLTTLNLDFSLFRQITDAGVQQLATSMPRHLISLSLAFKHSDNADAALQQLARNMPQNLISLCLDFGWSDLITGTFVQQLATSMPPNLTSLSLDFQHCDVADTSFQKLASSLPQDLTTLNLDLKRCTQITDACVQQLAMSMPPNLASLCLNFLRCNQISDASLQQLASSMPHNLTALNLDFSYCEQITDASVQKLASSIPQSLASLSLSLIECKDITDASLQQLANRMPENLTSLRLEFMNCEQITDASLRQLANRMPQNLVSLLLNFHDCGQITRSCAQKFAEQMEEVLFGEFSCFTEVGFYWENSKKATAQKFEWGFATSRSWGWVSWSGQALLRLTCRGFGRASCWMPRGFHEGPAGATQRGTAFVLHPHNEALSVNLTTAAEGEEENEGGHIGPSCLGCVKPRREVAEEGSGIAAGDLP
eukprot:s635_g20.t1